MIFILALGMAIVGMFGILFMVVLLNIFGFIGLTLIIDPKNDGDKTYDCLGKVSRQKATLIILLFIPIGFLLLLRQRRIDTWNDYLNTL